MRAKWWGAALLVVGVMAGVWLRPALLSMYHVARGARALDTALVPVFAGRLAPEQIVDGPLLESGIASLHQALVYTPTRIHVRRLLARAYVSQGQLEAALALLEEVTATDPVPPMVYLEIGDLYDLQGDSEHAVAYYERGRVGTRVVPLTANYLKLAQAYLEEGDGHSAIRTWQAVLRINPDNLYALMQLIAMHQELGDEATAASYTRRAQQFAAAAAEVQQDFRLAEYQGEAMAALVEQGIWDRAMLLNLVSYQVWHYNEGVESLMTARVLETVLSHWPDDPDLLFYRAELYHRQGDATRAEAGYQRALAADASYAPVYLRLGMLAEHDCAAAIQWYERYQALQPTDLLGAQRLLAAYEACGQAPPLDLQAFVTRQCDLQQIAANLLGVSPDALSLGQNLVPNGAFEDWSAAELAGWAWSAMFNRTPFAEALFYGGAETLDSLHGERHARIYGVWVAEPEAGQSRARAGYWWNEQPGVSLQSGGTYLISFYYRTTQMDSQDATIWLTGEHEIFWRNDRQLPPTEGAWQHFVAIGTNRSAEAVTVRPLVRSFGSGVVAFDAVGVYEVESEREVMAPLFFVGGE